MKLSLLAASFLAAAPVAAEVYFKEQFNDEVRILSFVDLANIRYSSIYTLFVN